MFIKVLKKIVLCKKKNIFIILTFNVNNCVFNNILNAICVFNIIYTLIIYTFNNINSIKIILLILIIFNFLNT